MNEFKMSFRYVEFLRRFKKSETYMLGIMC